MSDSLFVNTEGLENLNNKYELIIVAAKRSRQLRDGTLPLIKMTTEKEPIIALREVLAGKIVAVSVPKYKGTNHTTE